MGALVGLTVASCSWMGGGDPTVVDCPTARLLEGADRLVGYEPGRARSGTAIRHIAAINGLEATCRRGDAGLEVDLTFKVVAEAGPAFGGDPVPLELFIASVDDGRLVARQPLSVDLVIDAAGGRAGSLEELTIAVPPRLEDGLILVGFELDPATREERLERLRR